MIFIVGGRNQGKEAFAKSLDKDNYKVIVDYHLMIRQQLKDNKDPVVEAEDFFGKNSDVIVVSDEVGMGIVPTDSFERRYRDEVGRTHIWIAKNAEEVYRVICGIGQRIK